MCVARGGGPVLAVGTVRTARGVGQHPGDGRAGLTALDARRADAEDSARAGAGRSEPSSFEHSAQSTSGHYPCQHYLWDDERYPLT